MMDRKLNTRLRVLFDRRDAHLFRGLTRLKVHVVLLGHFDLTRHFHQRGFEPIESLKEILRRFSETRLVDSRREQDRCTA